MQVTNNLDQSLNHDDNISYEHMRRQVSDGLKDYRTSLIDRVKENGVFIIKYIYSRMQEQSLKPSSRSNMIQGLTQFSFYHNNKAFYKMDKNDVQQYLNSFDPTHPNYQTRLKTYKDGYAERKNNQSRTFSIEAYQQAKIRIESFFKWLYYPTVHTKRRQKPPIIQDLEIRTAKRKDKYDGEDMWTWDEDYVFLRYARSYKIKAFHAMARETKGRGCDLLPLKIGDLENKVDEEGKVYRLVKNIGKKGKMDEGRKMPLILSDKYLKDLLRVHPHGDNPDYFIFISENRKNRGRNLHTEVHSMYVMYQKEKEYFKELLNDQVIPDEDKRFIQSMLKKPWGNHIRRHTGLSDLADEKKGEPFIKAAGGFSRHSKAVNRYINMSQKELVNTLLFEGGFKVKTKAQDKKKLEPKYCPDCNQANDQKATFCYNCRVNFSQEAFYELQEQKKKDQQDRDQMWQELSNMKQILAKIAASGSPIRLSNNNDQDQIVKVEPVNVEYYDASETNMSIDNFDPNEMRKLVNSNKLPKVSKTRYALTPTEVINSQRLSRKINQEIQKDAFNNVPKVTLRPAIVKLAKRKNKK